MSIPRQELLAVFGKSAGESEVIVEQLYAPVASSTRGVHRVRIGGASAVMKLLTPPQRAGVDDEGSWGAQWSEGAPFYWRREAALFESGGLPSAEGFRLPACYGVFDRPDGSVAIWLEDLTAGALGTLLSPSDYPEVGRKLGQAQARWADVRLADTETFSAGWLVEYAERHGSDMELLADRAVLAHLPASAEVDGRHCDEVAAIWSERDRYLTFLDNSEQTVCHFDLTPKNLFVVGDQVVVIDWAFVGRGALGVDAGSFVANASADFLVPPAEAAALSLRFHDAFVQGLRDEGWAGDLEMIRGVCAATVAVKFAWLLPTILRAAISDWQSFNGRRKEEGMSWWSRLVPLVISEARLARTAAGF